MVNDPIGDLLAQIKNASMVGKKAIVLPYSRMKKKFRLFSYGKGFFRVCRLQEKTKRDVAFGSSLRRKNFRDYRNKNESASRDFEGM